MTFAEYHPEVRERIERAVRSMGKAQREKSERNRTAAEREACLEMETFFGDGFSDRELFISGLMLYLGAGTKTYSSLGMTNSDAAIITTFVLWLKKFCGIDVGRLRAFVNIYPDVDVEVAERIWPEITGIPRGQFLKTQVDRRENKSNDRRGKLQYGTVHVRVVGEGSIYLKHKVLKWIELYKEHISNMRV